MSEPTEHKNRTFTFSVVKVVVVDVIVPLLSALIGAGFLVSKADVIVKTNPTKEIQLNEVCTASENGFVLIEVHASPDNRSVGVDMEVDGRRLGATGAQDSAIMGVPSISATTMTIPVNKGSR